MNEIVAVIGLVAAVVLCIAAFILGRMLGVSAGSADSQAAIADLFNQLALSQQAHASDTAALQNTITQHAVFAEQQRSQTVETYEQRITELHQNAHRQLSQTRIDLNNQVGQARNENRELTTTLERTNQAFATLREAYASVQAKAHEESRAHDEQLRLLREAEERLKTTFQSTALSVLNTSNGTFIDLAKAHFDTLQKSAQSDLDQRTAAVATLVQPVKTRLDDFDKLLRDLETKRETAYGSVTDHIGRIEASNQNLRDETHKLVQALRTPGTAGRWGEIQLRRLVEMAGLLKMCDFLEQASFNDGDRLTRPDVVIKLPGSRCVAIDAKAPLEAFLEAQSKEDSVERGRALARHAKNVRTHIDALANRRYAEHITRQGLESPDFVMMFLPGEFLLMSAIEHDQELFEYAAAKGVVLASPMTLLAMLHAVARGWRQVEMSEQAQQVQGLAVELYDRLTIAFTHLGKVQRNLSQTVNAFNETIGSLEHRVFPAARKIREITGGQAHLPDVEQIDQTVRLVATPLEALFDQQRSDLIA